MASAGPAPSGKRSYDAEFNLVPFIDLLSCCIVFLLISAVWTQISKIDVKPKPTSPSQEQQQHEDVNISVHVRANGFLISDGSSGAELLKVGNNYPLTDLDTKLAAYRTQYTEISDVTVVADDAVAYKDLISVMDLCLKHNFTGISVSAAETI